MHNRHRLPPIPREPTALSCCAGGSPHSGAWPHRHRDGAGAAGTTSSRLQFVPLVLIVAAVGVPVVGVQAARFGEPPLHTGRNGAVRAGAASSASRRTSGVRGTS